MKLVKEWKPMAAIADPLLIAGIAFSLGMAAISLFPSAEREAGDINSKMVFRLLLGPCCLAVLILLLDGVANNLRLAWLLQL